MRVAGTTLRDLTICEHRVYLDKFGDPDLRDPVNPFTEFLWSLGNEFEAETIADEQYKALNLREVPREDRERLTLEAMEKGEPLIFGGRLSTDDLVGEPDLLRREDGGYVPLDVKSGMALDSAGKPKAHYAAQVSLYVDLLERHGRSAGRYAYIIDRNGDEVFYDLEAPKGPKTPRTLWDDYEGLRDEAVAIVSGEIETSPALSSKCGQCHWRSSCRERLQGEDDLTLVPDLSRSRREMLLEHVATLTDLGNLDPSTLLDEKGKSVVKGVGADTLQKFTRRARLIMEQGAPYANEPLTIPDTGVDLVLDIEDDSISGFCYLHGILVRSRDGVAVYSPFFADAQDAQSEHNIFAAAWNVIRLHPDATIFVYSKHEQSWWRNLQKRYPDVCTAEDIEDTFGRRVVDLYYGFVATKTVWPTTELSLKAIAGYLGYDWADEYPSGTNSLVWYRGHMAEDASCKPRIIRYNEDDCRATLAVADALRRMPVVSA
jgi:predicted RecB family nuclease